MDEALPIIDVLVKLQYFTLWLFNTYATIQTPPSSFFTMMVMNTFLWHSFLMHYFNTFLWCSFLMYITKHSSALYIGMAKVLPIIDVLGYDGQNYFNTFLWRSFLLYISIHFSSILFQCIISIHFYGSILYTSHFIIYFSVHSQRQRYLANLFGF